MLRLDHVPVICFLDLGPRTMHFLSGLILCFFGRGSGVVMSPAFLGRESQIWEDSLAYNPSRFSSQSEEQQKADAVSAMPLHMNAHG